MAKQKHMIL